MEKGVKAFVSYVRGYREHHCRFIFRMADLPLGRLATSLGLLRLPAMPEVRKAQGSLPHFSPSDVDPANVKASLFNCRLPPCCKWVLFKLLYGI